MLRSIIGNRVLLICCLAGVAGAFLITRYPFPKDNPMLMLIHAHAPAVFYAFQWTYTISSFTTPYILSSMLFSLAYVFLLRHTHSAGKGRLPVYPAPAGRSALILVVGEIHHPKEPIPSPHPRWLTIPERGLCTGIPVVGAIGSGKTSCCMYPFAEQILAYRHDEAQRRIGGLILEVKGDFCHKVRDILRRHGRGQHYFEIGLDSRCRYNPLHNDLEAYTLAYGIASLLNNLFGRGREPFWQQAYTNLVKFIILLHKVLYDYVTFFDACECAINPDLLEQRIDLCRQQFASSEHILVELDPYMAHDDDLSRYGFTTDPLINRMRAPPSEDVERCLQTHGTPDEIETVGRAAERSSPSVVSPRQEQFEAVERWLYNDWKRIEPKLRTSIVEGISVFLCGKEAQLKEQYSISKQGVDPGVHVLTGRTTSRETTVNTSKSYNVVRDVVFEPKTLAELKVAKVSTTEVQKREVAALELREIRRIRVPRCQRSKEPRQDARGRSISNGALCDVSPEATAAEMRRRTAGEGVACRG